MSTEIPAYQRDPRLRSLRARVLSRTESEEGHVVVLSDTVLYPEGGGQPSDRGAIEGVPVLDVRKRDDTIEHVVSAPIDADDVTVDVDWARRFDHMQQHTAQHLLTAIAADRFGWETTAFHLGDHVCDIELDAPTLTPHDLERLEEAVAEEIRAARPVKARTVSVADYEQLAVRSRGLPAGHTGDVRLVEIDGIDLNTCGGTHCASTAELEALKLLGTESMRGGTRLFFVAGARLRARLGVSHARSAELRALLGAADDEVVAVVQGRLEQVKESAKTIRRLEDDLATSLAEGLVARAGTESTAVAHWPDRQLPFLQSAARAVVENAPHLVLLLTGGGDAEGVFLVAAGESAEVDVRDLGARVAEVLGGRGGGSGSIFQGRASVLSRREQAEALIRGAPG